eukprot:TRINITY_DN76378_c0_g1_i1.p1 TRINITY_DN76378_c0_g1~~TRINITY_DN76378_c0_g1_i1.p1  ORF type:complete len:419 (+),score=93.40 TRINITY_DN76378_c0_g1_i1:149-1405(+)
MAAPPPPPPPPPPAPPAAKAFWFKFTVAGGSHLLRLRNPGTLEQEVLLDGAPVEAPPGTLTFTGPAASLLELQDIGDGNWRLLLDGAEVETYTPEDTRSPICWWKFAASGGASGTHHVRVKDIGRPNQEVLIDGAPLEAPPGTMTFTGPGACLLELKREGGDWILYVDGQPLQQANPAQDTQDPALVWEIELPTGRHTVSARCLNQRGHQIFLDGVDLQAPEGSTAFTGPGGCLLEIQKFDDGAWHLVSEGQSLGPGLSTADAAGSPTEASFSFVLPATGASHTLQAFNVGRQGQLVFIDGTELQAPPGTLTFTGPGGCLLELKLLENRWSLFVDGQGVSSISGRSSSLPGPVSLVGGDARMPVSPEELLPQGVSLDSSSGKYTAQIRVGGRFKNLGEFNTPAEASARYQAARKEMGL